MAERPESEIRSTTLAQSHFWRTEKLGHMFPVPSCILAAALMLAAGASFAQVKLEFGWPDGLQATVTHTKSRTRTEAPGAQSSTTFLYDMKATKGPAGIVISFANLRSGLSVARSTASGMERKQLEFIAQAALPPYVVKESGEFDRLEDAAGFKAAYIKAFKEAFPALFDIPETRQMLDRITSGDFLTDAVAEGWNQNVGLWLGATLDPGETYTFDSEGPIPLLPGRAIKMHSRFKVTREVPCSRNGQARKCVELEMLTSSDQGDVASAIAAMVQQIAPASSGKTLDGIDTISVEQELRLVTEADGLIPHQVTTIKRVTGSIRAGGEKQHGSEVQEVSVRYAYPGKAP